MTSDRIGKAVIVSIFAAVLITLLGFAYRNGGWEEVAHWLFTRGLGVIVGLAAVSAGWWVVRRAMARGR